MQVQDVSEEDYNEQMKVVYPQEKDIIYILKRKKEKDEITMITVGLELGEVPSALVSV